MSDTEDGSFDREAEKEKLREQLRREEEERRSTQHMSELLLKGATMTNKHCDECGDPIFRYQGREFCPTCGQEDAEVSDGTDRTASGEEPSARTGSTADTGGAGGGTETAGTGGVATSGGGESPEAGSIESPRPRQQGAGASKAPPDVAAARAALVRKLASLARQAEAADDVGRSRELLAAAREAAEALAAIDAIRG